MNTNAEAPRPKPGPPKPKATPYPQLAEAATTAANAVAELGKALEAPLPKPKFVRKPHLTEKPFRNHEGLQALAKQMEKKPTPRRGQRQTKKNQEKK